MDPSGSSGSISLTALLSLFAVGGMHRPNKPAQIRRVPPPTVPELTSHRHSGSSFSSGYGSLGQPDSRSSCGEEHLVPPHSPLDLPPSPGPGERRGGHAVPGSQTCHTSCWTRSFLAAAEWTC